MNTLLSWISWAGAATHAVGVRTSKPACLFVHEHIAVMDLMGWGCTHAVGVRASKPACLFVHEHITVMDLMGWGCTHAVGVRASKPACLFMNTLLSWISWAGAVRMQWV